MSASVRYRAIATIVKTHGRKGEVIAIPRPGLPHLLHEGMRVALVPPALKGPRWFAVSSSHADGNGNRVRFEGIESLSKSDVLVGKTVLAEESDLPDDFDLHDVSGLIGREVVDKTCGLLGTIEEVMSGPANDVWVIRGQYGEVLVPAVASMVVEFPEVGAIACDLPVGLVDKDGA